MSEALTTKQVAEHNTVEKGLYIIVDNDVYKLDSFVDEHPGGAKILKRVGGKDASKQFWKVRSAFAIPVYGQWLAAFLGVDLGPDANVSWTVS
jgi:cytochrome b involved in lipid metabolism